MMKKLLTLLAFFLGGMNFLLATHYHGGELSYQYLGGCDYRIVSTIYVDCAGASSTPYMPPNINNPFPAAILNFSGVGCTFSANPTWIIASAQDVTPTCPSGASACNGGATFGSAAYTYYADLDLCGLTCTSINASWSTCCRNYSITSGAGGGSIYTSINIPLTFNNSSPKFTSPPVFVISQGQTATYQQAAFDADGDSLVYSIAPCYSAAGTNVTYNTGYSVTNPLGPSWAVSINSATGDITFSPNPTGNIVTGLVGIKVEEYRNGQLIGQIYRDMPVNVLPTGTTPNTLPSATLNNVVGVGFQNTNLPATLYTQANHLISFEVVVTDPDPGQLLSYSSNLLTQFPNATLTANSTTSPMTLTFSWTPDTSHIGNLYSLDIDVFDSYCPNNGHYFVHADLYVDSALITAVITPTNCTTPTGAIDLTVLAGTSPYTFSWNNGATTEDISNLAAGAYSCFITDANGNTTTTDNYYVNSQGIAGQMVSLSPNCAMADGELQVNMTAGTAPFSYTWSNGQSTNPLTALAIGGYSVDITDANGCFLHLATLLEYAPLDSCASVIEGIVYLDANGNCVQDVGEVGVPNMYVNLSPGGAAITDANGYYSFTVYNAGAYTLQVIGSNNPNISSTCMTNLTQSTTVNNLGANPTPTNFGLTILPDVKVNIFSGNYVPGYTHADFISCHNISSYINTTDTLTFTHADSLLNVSFSLTPNSYDPLTRSATWIFTNFLPGDTKFITLYSQVDTLVTIGAQKNTYAAIYPTVGDAFPINNFDTTTRAVIAPYDPNYKAVSPMGQTSHGLISANTAVLEYEVHFQNTGNYPASFVVIKDEIDTDVLDITTTEIQMMSHPCTISVAGDSILVFTFNNINLPDSATDYDSSQGFVTFSIQLKPNLPLYTEIQNQAAIYFDFNAPIITNFTTNTLYNNMDLSLVNPVNICPNDSISAEIAVATGRAPFNFTWSNGTQDNNNLSGISEIPAAFSIGTHSVEVSDYYGMTVSESFNINVLPLADADFSYTAIGNSYQFVADANTNATYSWNFGNGQTSNATFATATYTQSGTYTISLTVTDQCGNTLTSTQNITLTVGLADNPFAQQVSLAPNPAKEFTVLSFSNENQDAYTLTIFDINGKNIQSFANIRGEKVNIPTQNMASGTYLWELKGKEVARGVLVVE